MVVAPIIVGANCRAAIRRIVGPRTATQSGMTFSRIFFFKQKTAYEISLGLVGSEMCIRDRQKLLHLGDSSGLTNKTNACLPGRSSPER